MKLRGLLVIVALLAGCSCNDGNITTGNTPPNATILQPTSGAEFSALVPLSLSGVVGDTGTPAAELRVTWSSDLSGELFDGAPDDDSGNTAFVWDTPDAGEHIITLAVLDPAGASASAQIAVTLVGNQAPTCEITSPGDGAVNAAAPVALAGQVGDLEDAAEDLAIRWLSDEDGVLDEAAPATTGSVSAAVPLTPGPHVVTLEVTDTGGLTCTDTVALDANEPPSTPGIELSPADPTTFDDLSVAVTTESVDPEGTTVTYLYTWSADSVEQAALTGTVVPAAELDEGELWLVTVVAEDGTGLQSQPATAAVTVANAPPTAPTVSVAPTAPTQAEDLVCSVDIDSTDPDGDGVTYGFAWELDGVPTAFTSATLSWAETEAGDLWTCVVTPNDGDEDGPSASATVQIGAGCASIAVPAGGDVTVPDATALRLAGGDFTVEAWLRPTTGNGTVAAKGAGAGGWQMSIAGDLQVTVGGTVVTSSVSVLTGVWTHVAATWDAGSGLMTLWIDGANVGSATLPAPGATVTADLLIGTEGSLGFDGLIDDLRLSDIVRYSAPFVPASQLGADADTIAWWGFEEGAGTTAKDLSNNGHDGTLVAPAAFDTTDSTCSNDQPPTAPTVEVTPEYPLLSEDLTCTLITPSVDPEGSTVTYDGTWLVDGAPSGQTFSSFPATLPAGLTSEGEEWTCNVTASDGGQSGPAGEDSVFTGAMPIGVLVVADPANPAATNIPFTPPVAGLVRATMDNPDASADGAFTIDTLGFGVTHVFTGIRDWAYDGVTVSGWATTDVEFNLDPSVGTVTFDVDYDAASGVDNTGTDTLTLEFVYGTQLSTTGAAFVMGSDVGPQDTTLSQLTHTFTAGERLLIETVQCGFGGGGHGLYADGDNQPDNDGIVRVDTGFTGDCLIPLQSRPIGAGTWNLTLANEDDFFSDNTDQREVNVYRYTP